MKDIIKLLRVKQWVKNLFIFLPAFFGLKLLDANTLINNGYAFISFCFLASSIYILNDILDKDADKKHPKKRERPIASGKISIKEGIVILIISLILAIVFTLPIKSTDLYILLLSYLAINIFYTFRIKYIEIVDVFFIAAGYVIRVLVGGVSGGIEINYWIIIMTFLLALLLGFAKRRDDVVLMESQGEKIRKSIDGYTLQFVDSVLNVTSAITVVAYIMYTISEQTMQRYHSKYVYITSFFVLLGIFRYLQITISFKRSGSPTEVLYKDRFLQLCILGWIICFAIIIYL